MLSNVRDYQMWPRRFLLLIACFRMLHPAPVLALEANEIFKRADPSVVVIVAEGTKRADDALGSGVIVKALDVVTSCHVVQNAVRITVKQGSVQRSAKLRYQDVARDLCQIRLDDALPSGRPVAGYAASKDLEVGQQVFAIGSPRGLEHTISRGIVSALREMKEETGNLIQTDAAISPGSSGGGLFDAEGRLIGIITFQFKEAQNLNFAVPADWVQDLATRNRDRLADNPRSNDSRSSPDKSSAVSLSSEPPRVGDRWKYRLLDGGRPVGTVVVELTETRNNSVQERITREDERKLLVERVVDAQFNPIRFLDAVTSPGGFQLAEMSPYVSAEQGPKPGQRWTNIPASFQFKSGRKSILMQAKVVKQERVRVPAGEFDTTLVEATGNDNSASIYVRVTCRFWYAAKVKRSVKMSLSIAYDISALNGNAEIYELTAFEPAK